MAGNPKSTKISKSIGLRIKKMCAEKYATKSDCARALGVSPQNWAQVEAGRVRFDQDKIFQYAAFFGVDPGWLLTGREANAAGDAQASKTPADLAGDNAAGELSTLLPEAHKALEILAESVAAGEVDAAVALRAVEGALNTVWQAHGTPAQSDNVPYSKAGTRDTGIA